MNSWSVIIHFFYNSLLSSEANNIPELLMEVMGAQCCGQTVILVGHACKVMVPSDYTILHGTCNN